MRILKGLLLLSMIILCSTSVFSKEYYLYDAEKNKVLVMNHNDVNFHDQFELPSKPDLIIQTGIADQLLIVYTYSENNPGKAEASKSKTQGELVIINSATGKVEDSVLLGFAPYKWVYSEDGLHFFITYRSSPEANSYELLHYDLKEKKAEKLNNFAKAVFSLALSEDGGRLYASVLLDGVKVPQLLFVEYSPLKIKANTPAGNNPQNIYVLGPNRLVLLDMEQNKLQKPGKGTLRIIDTTENSTIYFRKLQPISINTQWFKDDKTLIITYDVKSALAINSFCYKITADSFRFYRIPSNWVDIKYLPDKDTLYILMEDQLKLIDFKNSASLYCNTAGQNFLPSNNQLFRLINTSYMVISCADGTVVKFFDLEQKKLLKKIKAGRPGAKISNSLKLAANKGEIVVTANEQKNQFYIFNSNTNDITVWNRESQKLKFIVPPEPWISVNQITQPVLQTIVITNKKVYKIDDVKMTLNPIAEFKEVPKTVQLIEENERIVLITEKELLVLNPVNWELKSSFNLDHNPDEKNSSLKIGEPRYNLINSLPE